MNQTKGKQERIKANWIQKTDESKNESKDRFQIKTASFGETNLRTCGLCECGRQCRRRVRRRWRCWPETRTECDIKGDRRGVRCVWGFGGSLFFLFVLVIFICIYSCHAGKQWGPPNYKQYSKGCLDLPLESHRQLLQSSKLYFLLKKN